MFARLSLIALILLAAPALAQTPQPGWIADSKTGCRVWNANPNPNETITWSGTCSNGLAQGGGVLQWLENGKPSERSEGEFRDGKLNGGGVTTWSNGDRYDGEFRDGKLNGRGVHTSTNGDRYEGEWRDNKPNGVGTLTEGTEVYSGTWTNGCFQQGNRRMNFGATAKECGFE